MAVGEHDERAVGETESEVGVARVEGGNRGVVLTFEDGDGKASGGQVGEEGSSSWISKPLGE
jgi:hypothetical protein